jgi:hypothetical protein
MSDSDVRSAADLKLGYVLSHRLILDLFQVNGTALPDWVPSGPDDVIVVSGRRYWLMQQVLAAGLKRGLKPDELVIERILADQKPRWEADSVSDLPPLLSTQEVVALFDLPSAASFRTLAGQGKFVDEDFRVGGVRLWALDTVVEASYELQERAKTLSWRVNEGVAFKLRDRTYDGPGSQVEGRALPDFPTLSLKKPFLVGRQEIAKIYDQDGGYVSGWASQGLLSPEYRIVVSGKPYWLLDYVLKFGPQRRRPLEPVQAVVRRIKKAQRPGVMVSTVDELPPILGLQEIVELFGLKSYQGFAKQASEGMFVDHDYQLSGGRLWLLDSVLAAVPVLQARATRVSYEPRPDVLEALRNGTYDGPGSKQQARGLKAAKAKAEAEAAGDS